MKTNTQVAQERTDINKYGLISVHDDKYGQLLGYRELGIDNSHVFILKILQRDGIRYVDIRPWTKWAQDGKFHPTKGLCMKERYFIKDVLPLLIEEFADELAQQTAQQQPDTDAAIVEKLPY